MRNVTTRFQSPKNLLSQGELFVAETHWFHIFKSMVDSGDIAKMGPHALTVYAVLKAHTNFNTGRSFPALETISEKSGISIAQIKRELKVLVEMGYITKTKMGRRNEYTLREKVQITDVNGRPQAVASWDYLPAYVGNAVTDLKNVLLTGKFHGASIVHIERLQVNVNNIAPGGINLNVQNLDIEQLLAHIEQLPPQLREKMKSAFASSRNFCFKDIHSSV